jgi:hypothetical protein
MTKKGNATTPPRIKNPFILRHFINTPALAGTIQKTFNAKTQRRKRLLNNFGSYPGLTVVNGFLSGTL